MAYVGGPDFSAIYCTTVSSTGAFHNIAPYVEEFSGIDLQAILHESHTFGDAYAEQLYTGFRRLGDITLKGPYNDVAASGPNAILGLANLGGERVLKLNIGTTNAYPKIDVIVKSFKILPMRGELTMYESVLAPTGTYTIATT